MKQFGQWLAAVALGLLWFVAVAHSMGVLIK